MGLGLLEDVLCKYCLIKMVREIFVWQPESRTPIYPETFGHGNKCSMLGRKGNLDSDRRIFESPTSSHVLIHLKFLQLNLFIGENTAALRLKRTCIP